MRAAWLCCWLSIFAAGLAGEEIHCPKTISVRQVALDVPTGWIASLDTSTPPTLKSVAFFDGKPEEEASLVYDRMVPGRSGMRALWSFQPNQTVWLACQYTGTSVIVARQLKGFTRCAVNYKREATIAGLPEIEAIFCR